MGHVIRVSSKGQIVIPAALRRGLGLKTGQSLIARAGKGGEIVLRKVEADDLSFEEMHRRFRAAFAKSKSDPLKALHERRRREREAERRERRGH